MPATPQNFGYDDALSFLIALLSLSGDSSGASKSIAAARLAGKGAELAGYPGAAGGLGAAAGAAGLGLNLADIAKSDLSTQDKVGQGVGGAFDLGASALIPYYGQSKLVEGIGNMLRGSSSPQVSGAGTAISYTGAPAGAKIFNTSIRGRNPFKGMTTQDVGKEFTLDLLGPLGAALRGAGLGGKVAGAIMDYGPLPGFGQLLKMFGGEPTTGTQFRDAFNQIAGKAGFSDFKGTERYNMDADAYTKMDPRTKDAASTLGYFLASFAPQFKKNPFAYGIQGQNVLLNQYGDQVLSHADRLLKEVKPEDVFKQIASAGALGPDELAGVWRSVASYYGVKSPMPKLG